MNNSILILGGVRSGKSEFAENLTLQLSKNPIYISTCKVIDEETKYRIQKHKLRRNKKWTEYEAYTNLLEIIDLTNGDFPRLVDCITLWINNLIFENLDCQKAIKKLVNLIKSQKSPIIFVTSEVGLGITPNDKLARDFIDILGYANRTIAENVNTVYYITAGISTKIKG